MSPYVCALDLGEWDGRKRKRRDWSLAVLERRVCHRQAELELLQVARQLISCCNGAARVTSCWYQGVRENVVCRGQGEIQVKSSCLSGLGMKGPAGTWMGKAGSALPAIKPLSHPSTLLPAEYWAQERRSGFLCSREQSLLVFLTLLSSHTHVLGQPWAARCAIERGRGRGKGCVWRQFLLLR